MPVYLFTYHAYQSWMPDRARGFVQKGRGIQPPNEALAAAYRQAAIAVQRGGRSAREANVRGAFRVARPDQVEGRRLLVIDDVFTTGATANECAKTLLATGAAEVAVYTLARVK